MAWIGISNYWNSLPTLKAILDSQQKTKDAAAFLVAAKRTLQTNENGAISVFKDIVKLYPGTPSADEAAQILAQREGESNARKIVERGQNYENTLMFSKAREQYQKVLDQYPNSKAAADAKKRLEQLRGQ